MMPKHNTQSIPTDVRRKNTVRVKTFIKKIGVRLECLSMVLLAFLTISPSLVFAHETVTNLIESADGTLVDEFGQLAELESELSSQERVPRIYYGQFDQMGSNSVFEMCRAFQEFVRVRIDGKFIKNVNPKPGGWRAYVREHKLVKRSHVFVNRCPF